MNSPDGASEFGPDRLIAVIPCFNERETVLSCVASLHRDQPGVGVIVVDDGSTDGTAAALDEAFDNVTVLRGDGNLWWSGAVNVGVIRARELGATHVILMNNDTVLDAGAIAGLYRSSVAAGAVVGAAVVDLTTSAPESYGGFIGPKGPETRLAEPEPGPDGLIECAWLPGYVMVVPMAAFDRAGLCDARRFPQYWGDTDLTMRMRRHGVRIVVDPRIVAKNDRTNTGLRLAYPVRPANLWKMLTAQKSWLRVSDNVAFWRAHDVELTWKQLARRYEAIPYNVALEFLERTHLRRILQRARHSQR